MSNSALLNSCVPGLRLQPGLSNWETGRATMKASEVPMINDGTRGVQRGAPVVAGEPCCFQNINNQLETTLY